EPGEYRAPVHPPAARASDLDLPLLAWLHPVDGRALPTPRSGLRLETSPFFMRCHLLLLANGHPHHTPGDPNHRAARSVPMEGATHAHRATARSSRSAPRRPLDGAAHARHGMEGEIHRTISFVVTRPGDPQALLTVLRPPDDPDLPDAWGLPAGRVRPGESWTDAVRRAGREKLGVELDVGRELNRGSTRRAAYLLQM